MRDQTISIREKIANARNARNAGRKREVDSTGITAIIEEGAASVSLPAGVLQSITVTPLAIEAIPDMNFTVGFAIKNGIEEVRRNYVISRLSSTLNYATRVPASLLTITLNEPLKKLALTVNMVNT